MPAVPKLVKKFSAFHGNRKLRLPCSQKPAIRHCPKPDQPSPHPHIQFAFKIHSNIITQSTLDFPNGSFLQVSSPKPCMRYFSPWYVPHAPPIPSFPAFSSSTESNHVWGSVSHFVTCWFLWRVVSPSPNSQVGGSPLVDRPRLLFQNNGIGPSCM